MIEGLRQLIAADLANSLLFVCNHEGRHVSVLHHIVLLESAFNLRHFGKLLFEVSRGAAASHQTHVPPAEAEQILLTVLERQLWFLVDPLARATSLENSAIVSAADALVAARHAGDEGTVDCAAAARALLWATSDDATLTPEMVSELD
jgi:hypothetical protein